MQDSPQAAQVERAWLRGVATATEFGVASVNGVGRATVRMVVRLVWILMPLLLLLLLPHTAEVSAEPGHMVHDYYKCQSDFFKDSIKCREEAELQRGMEYEAEQRRMSGNGQNCRVTSEYVLCLVLGFSLALFHSIQ